MTKNIYSRKQSLKVGLCVICTLTAVAAYAETRSNMNQSRNAPGMAQDTQEEMRNMAKKSPKEVCMGLVEASKKDDMAAFQKWTMRGGMAGHQGMEQGGEASEDQASQGQSPTRQGMNAMHERMSEKMGGLSRANMSEMKNLSCGTEHIAGDHAVVEATSRGERRLLPFIKENGVWKFDGRTYMSFYRGSMRESTG